MRKGRFGRQTRKLTGAHQRFCGLQWWRIHCFCFTDRIRFPVVEIRKSHQLFKTNCINSSFASLLLFICFHYFALITLKTRRTLTLSNNVKDENGLIYTVYAGFFFSRYFPVGFNKIAYFNCWLYNFRERKDMLVSRSTEALRSLVSSGVYGGRYCWGLIEAYGWWNGGSLPFFFFFCWRKFTPVTRPEVAGYHTRISWTG